MKPPPDPAEDHAGDALVVLERFSSAVQIPRGGLFARQHGFAVLVLPCARDNTSTTSPILISDFCRAKPNSFGGHAAFGLQADIDQGELASIAMTVPVRTLPSRPRAAPRLSSRPQKRRPTSGADGRVAFPQLSPTFFAAGCVRRSRVGAKWAASQQMTGSAARRAAAIPNAAIYRAAANAGRRRAPRCR